MDPYINGSDYALTSGMEYRSYGDCSSWDCVDSAECILSEELCEVERTKIELIIKTIDFFNVEMVYGFCIIPFRLSYKDGQKESHIPTGIRLVSVLSKLLVKQFYR